MEVARSDFMFLLLTLHTSFMFCNYILNVVVAQLQYALNHYHNCNHRAIIHALTLEPAGSDAYHSVPYYYRYILFTCVNIDL